MKTKITFLHFKKKRDGLLTNNDFNSGKKREKFVCLFYALLTVFQLCRQLAIFSVKNQY